MKEEPFPAALVKKNTNKHRCLERSFVYIRRSDEIT
jgi:hypothetical protein